MIERFEGGKRLSQAVAAEGLVFLAGQVAGNGKASVQDQTREVLANVEALLAKAGSSKANILSVTVYLANIADFAAMNEVYDAWLDRANLPTRACVEARLADPDLRVEIVVVAARG